MKKTVFISVLVLIFSVMANAATTKISTLRQSSFFGWVENSEIAGEVVKNNIGAVKYALDTTGYGEIFFALCEQTDKVSIEEIEVMPGEEIIWMLFKSRGFQRVLRNVEWAGKESFKAFLFKIVYQNKRFEFVVPQACGNISLLRVTECASFEPALPDEPEKIEIPDKPEPEELISSESTLERFSHFGDANFSLVRGCYGKYLPSARVGFEYKFSSKTSIAVTAGGAIPLEINQSRKWQPFFMTDVTLRHRPWLDKKFWKLFSFGIGAGYSSLAREDRCRSHWESVFNIGIHVSKEAMIFGEIRIPWKEFKNLDVFPKTPHKILFGIRCFSDKK